MSGSNITGDLLHPTPATAVAATQRETGERMPWPGAALLVLLLSAGLWAGIWMAFSRLFG